MRSLRRLVGGRPTLDNRAHGINPGNRRNNRGEAAPVRRGGRDRQLSGRLPVARRARRDAGGSLGRAGRDDPRPRHPGDGAARAVRGPARRGSPARGRRPPARLRDRGRGDEGVRHRVGGAARAAPHGAGRVRRLRAELLARSGRGAGSRRGARRRPRHVQDRGRGLVAGPGGARLRAGPGRRARRLPGRRARRAGLAAHPGARGDAGHHRRRAGDRQPLGGALGQALAERDEQSAPGDVRARLHRGGVQRGGPDAHDRPRRRVRPRRPGPRAPRARVRGRARRAMGGRRTTGDAGRASTGC